MFPAARKYRGKISLTPHIIEVKIYGRTFSFAVLQNGGSTDVLESLKGGAFSIKIYEISLSFLAWICYAQYLLKFKQSKEIDSAVTLGYSVMTAA